MNRFCFKKNTACLLPQSVIHCGCAILHNYIYLTFIHLKINTAM